MWASWHLKSLSTWVLDSSIIFMLTTKKTSMLCWCFLSRIHQYPQKGPVMQKICPYQDIIMESYHLNLRKWLPSRWGHGIGILHDHWWSYLANRLPRYQIFRCEYNHWVWGTEQHSEQWTVWLIGAQGGWYGPRVGALNYCLKFIIIFFEFTCLLKCYLTHKQLETHGCVISTGATDVLVLSTRRLHY